MSDFFIHRHAELVSASISQSALSELVAQWTLKQVQGDGIEALAEGRRPND